jgi:hypothetical protein
MENETVECIYLLDEHGTQRTETHCRDSGNRDVRFSMFQPAPNGANHALKDYYYRLRASNSGSYCTEPYLSRATGRLCRTVSVHTYAQDLAAAILCIDFSEQS